MQRSIRGLVRSPSAGTALTITAAILLTTQIDAQRSAPSSPPTGSGGDVKVDLSPKNKLVFPFGVQKFDRRENIKVGDPITVLPGWTLAGQTGMVVATVEESPMPLGQGGLAQRWLAIEDEGVSLGQGLASPNLNAPAAWNYAWSFRLQVESAPATDVDAPVLAIQHSSFGQPVDAFGVRFLTGSAELFMTSIFGQEASFRLFDYTGATALGQWIDVRMVADLTKNTLTAFVNGAEIGMVRTRPEETTDVTNLRFSYHGMGAGNVMDLKLDEVGVAFLNPVCIEDHTYDMATEDDFATALANGQQIDVGFEFGAELTIAAAAGPNNGAAIFDSTPGGPNDPSQDLDLLIGQGNLLILQTDAGGNPPKVGDIYPRPNDDEEGGAIDFAFNRPCSPISIDLVDIDAAGNEGMVLVLTDYSALTRTYTVPADWTGDLTLFQPGVGTLDLQTLAAQAGFNSIATAVEDPGFDPNAVVSMTVTLGGSGALDNLHVVIPCVQMSFETEDDATPVSAGTPLVDGQDLSTPPEFGVELAISSSGPNSGAALFDSTPGGPNDPGPDNDLLVGLGNILILQNNQFATQTTAGIFDTPNDDTNGGDIVFTYPAPVHVHQLDLIDADEEEITGVTVVLLDNGGKTRTFSVPPGWTRDLLNDGPPGFGTLDLDTLAPQAGFAAVATAVEDPGFNPDAVVQMTVTLGGAQAMDNVCHCP